MSWNGRNVRLLGYCITPIAWQFVYFCSPVLLIPAEPVPIRLYCLSILLSFTPILVHGQDLNTTPSPDSLQNALAHASNDEERIKITLALAEKFTKRNPFLALDYVNESVVLASKLKSDSLLTIANYFQGNIYMYLANYPRALQFYQAAIQGAQTLGDSMTLSGAQANLGVVYYYQRDLDNALRHYLEGLAPLSNSHDKKKEIRKANLLNNIGSVYDEIKKFDESEYYYDQALVIAQKWKEFEVMGNVLNNKGTLSRDRGDKELAFKYYKEALAIRKEDNNKLGLARSYHNIGSFFLEHLGDLDSAQYYLRRSIDTGEEIGLWETVASSSDLLYEVHRNKGEYKEALEALELNRRVNDSLFNRQTTRKVTQLEMQFDFDRKRSIMEAERKERELYFWIVVGATVLLLIIITLLLVLQRSKTRRSELEQAQLKLEKVNLKNDLALKDKELAANIMYLLNKNELINNVSEKLLEIKNQVAPSSQAAVQKVVLDLQSNLQPELWQEFEYRFQQVHEHFYKTLNEKFPDLTPHEIRLCAFLKLNMTTKEISAITHQNAKSIDVARTRLRKKLNLTGTDHNLVTFLSQLDKPAISGV
jgi:tetratricopeptide (TPR) repeat protein